MDLTQSAFGIDVAQSDGAISRDPIMAHIPRVSFIGIRASISWAYPTCPPYLDRWDWFKKVWSLFEDIGRVAYHVLYPGEDGKRQLDNHLKVVPPRPVHARRVIDAELDHGQTRKVITDRCEYLVKGMQDADGVTPIIYSRTSWVNEFMEYRPWWDTVDWWLAQFLLDRSREDDREMMLPKGVTRWLIKQTGDKCTPFGIEAKEMDYDRFNGDEAAVRKYFGFLDHTVALPVVVNNAPLEQQVAKMQQFMMDKFGYQP